MKSVDIEKAELKARILRKLRVIGAIRLAQKEREKPDDIPSPEKGLPTSEPTKAAKADFIEKQLSLGDNNGDHSSVVIQMSDLEPKTKNKQDPVFPNAQLNGTLPNGTVVENDNRKSASSDSISLDLDSEDSIENMDVEKIEKELFSSVPD